MPVVAKPAAQIKPGDAIDGRLVRVVEVGINLTRLHCEGGHILSAPHGSLIEGVVPHVEPAEGLTAFARRLRVIDKAIAALEADRAAIIAAGVEHDRA